MGPLQDVVVVGLELVGVELVGMELVELELVGVEPELVGQAFVPHVC